MPDEVFSQLGEGRAQIIDQLFAIASGSSKRQEDDLGKGTEKKVSVFREAGWHSIRSSTGFGVMQKELESCPCRLLGVCFGASSCLL